MDLAESHPELAQIQANPELANVLGMDFESLFKSISLLIYGAVIFGSVLVQGGTALYYFTRARHVHEFRRQTPEWVVDLLVTGAV